MGKESSAEERVLHGIYDWMLKKIGYKWALKGSILFNNDWSSPERLIEKNHIFYLHGTPFKHHWAQNHAVQKKLVCSMQ